MTATMNVTSAKRTIELELSPEEAEKFADWIDTAAAETMPPYIGRILFGALRAIAESREYGGH